MNNLYGGAQKRPLPYRKFQWVSEKCAPDQLERLNQYFQAKCNILESGGQWEQNLNSETWFPNDLSHDWTEDGLHPNGGDRIDVENEERWEFFLEVDIEFKDKETAQKMDAFPPAPENISISLNDLSRKSRELLGKYKNGVPDKYESSKLLTHLQPRRNYILHSQNAELYTDLGMRITKVS